LPEQGEAPASGRVPLLFAGEKISDKAQRLRLSAKWQGMQFLIITLDSVAESIFRRIAPQVSATVDFRGDAKTGSAALEQKRFDVVVIDCDDVYRGNWLLQTVRKTRPNKSSVVIAIVDGATQVVDALDQGANFVIAKPLFFERVRSEIRHVCTMLAAGQRSDRRHVVRLPVYITFGQVLERRAEAVNLSLGGMGVRVSQPIDEDEIIHVRFSLPGCNKPVRARGELVWSDREGNAGIKFIAVHQDDMTLLSRWLEHAALGVNSELTKQ